jgi:hypothetical protein
MKKIFLILVFVLAGSSVNALGLNNWNWIGYTYATYNRTITICDTCEYASVSSAETAHEQDLVNNDSSLIYQIKAESDGTWADQSATQISGSTTGSANFITVTATGGGRHSGEYDATGAWRAAAAYQPVYVADDFTVLDGLQSNCNSTSNNRYAFWTAAEGVTVKNCIGHYTNTGANGYIFYMAGGDATNKNYLQNCVGYAVGAATPNYGVGVGLTDAVGLIVTNVTIANCIYAVGGTDNDVVLFNVIGYNNTTGFTECQPAASPLSDYNATDDASIDYNGCGSCGSNDITSISDPFNDASSYDFSYASSSSDGVEDGMDASAYQDSDDIIGTSRPQTTNWDIGAFEYEGGAPEPSEMNYRRRRLLGEYNNAKIFNTMYFVACCDYR